MGTMMALPFLESFGHRAFAATKTQGAPLRMAFLYSPNGVNEKEWFPRGQAGKGYEFGPSMKEALEAHRNDFSVITGLCHDKARSNGDGGGDHARATATFLTGVQAKKTAGADIHLGVSVDQIAADKVGNQTKLGSLELSTDGQRSAGRCDSGYSCAYQFNLSWRNESTPMAPEMDPRLVFERVFGAGAGGDSPEAKRRRALQKGVLDTVLSDAKSLQSRVSAQDRAKLDEYYSSVRDIETRIERAEKLTKALPPGTVAPSGIPDSYEQHIHTMFDILALAFQTDSTRVSTFLMAHDGSNRSFPEIGVPENHHGISHHQHDPEKLRKIGLIDQFYLRQLGYFLTKLKSIKEGDGNLLDNSMIVYGSGISDPDRHDHSHLPVILAGHGRGTLNPGSHVALQPNETPMTNLYLALLDRMGAPAERVGDSTGKLEGI
ncbi:MAG: hypothetical protein JWO94_3078 [Verrucomicrobiaceae bacterium]|nr:hypothetical protein [Verrucomicrobiaceae bacterium]